MFISPIPAIRLILWRRIGRKAGIGGRSGRSGRFIGLCLLLACSVIACGDRAQRRAEQAQLGQEIARQYVGQRTESLTTDAAYEGGSWLGETPGGEYGIELRVRGETRMVWLVRAVSRDSLGDPLWEVADVLVIPPTGRDERFSFFECRLNGQPDPEVLAVVRVQDQQWLDDVRSAWRANTATGRIEVIPTDGVVCENDSYGI